jgi:hypothetical protein
MSSNTAARSGVRTSYMSLVAGTFTVFKLGREHISSLAPFLDGIGVVQQWHVNVFHDACEQYCTVITCDVCVHLALVKMRVYIFRIRIT